VSTRSSIWLGECNGKYVHIYWELAERETGGDQPMRAPIYLVADSGDENQEVVISLPKDIAIRFLIALSDNFADQVAQIT
jgi:hypothetical protein